MDRVTQAARMLFWILAAIRAGMKIRDDLQERVREQIQDALTEDEPDGQPNELAQELGQFAKKMQDDLRSHYAAQAERDSH